MNFSYGTLHITGSPAAIDKHQPAVIRHTLTRLHQIPRFASRCADDFRVVRQLPGYLTIFFSVPEGYVPTSLARANDVLVDDHETTDDASDTSELASKLNISHLVPKRDSAARFALLPGAPALHVSEPYFRVVLPVVEYLNADPATGKYQKGAVPEVRLSHLIAGPREFGEIMSATDGYEQSPFDCDLVLSAPRDPRFGRFDVDRVANKARWNSNPDVAVVVAAQSTMQDSAGSSLPGATLITTLEALRAVAPDPKYLVALQTAPVEDRLVTLLTWADESCEFTQEHSYLVVQTGSERGDQYHAPITQIEFLRAFVTLNNYLAARIIREAVQGYPQPFDTAAIDAEVRAEVVGQDEAATDHLDGPCDGSGLADLD